MNSPETIVRCKNEMPYVEQTLRALQRSGARIFFFDSGSTDGSLEVARRAGVEIIPWASDAYVPGRVLNDAMTRTTGDIVAFVNADAIPQSDDAVARMVDACTSGAAAAYGRQVPRSGARPSTVFDYGRAFPANTDGNGWRHFFSMAASAIRRDAWEALAFDSDLLFSEDVDWTFRLRALGLEIRYVPNAVFEHSHDYDRAGLRRRMAGEGAADTSIFRLNEPTLKEFIAPLAMHVARDVRSGSWGREQLALRTTAQLARVRGRKMPPSRPPHSTGDTTATTRLTLSGDARAERAVENAVERALVVLDREFGDASSATLLLGGYGCGEGAVDEIDGVFHVHNDLDLALVVPTRRDARALRGRCRAAGERASSAAETTVDVSPVSMDELREPRGRLLWIDAAVRGVRVLRGDADVVRSLRGLGARAVAPSEIGRLLTNRATGIALSRLAFEAGEREESRGARHVAKAWLAAGDALLITVDQYKKALAERVEELAKLARVGAPFVASIAAGYSAAEQFRRNPTSFRITAEALEIEREPLWRAFSSLEAHRLAIPIAPVAWDYALSPKRIFPELPDLNPIVRHLGGVRAAMQGILGWEMARRHPREALGRASVLLAFAADLAKARTWVARALHAQSDAPHDISRALETLRDRTA